MRGVLSLPKVHLHVHLESTVRERTLREIAGANGLAVPPRTRDTGVAMLSEHNGAVRDCLRAPDDFRRVARELIEDEAATGTRYVEVTFTAASHGERLGDLDMPLSAVLDGLDAGAEGTGVEFAVILDHPRRRSVERAWQTLDLARRYRDRGVVAIGVAGQEAHSISRFAEVFSAAERHGVRRVHHAGEECGPASIREVLTTGRAERIGHGITALEDGDLVAELRNRGVPLEVCPSSNVALGLVPTLGKHPIERLRDAGLIVTVNTDVPSSTGMTLTSELEALRDQFGWGDGDVAELNLAAIEATFAPDATKRRLREATGAWLAA